MVIEELLFRRPVVCYLMGADVDLSPDIVGKDVRVAGTISRDSDSGHPVAIRAIRSVEVLPVRQPDLYRRVRGILPPPKDGSTPEERIRRLRDDV